MTDRARNFLDSASQKRPASSHRWLVFAGMVLIAALAAGGVWWIATWAEPATAEDAPSKVSLSEQTRSVAAGDILKVIFETAPPATRKPAAPIRFQFGLFARRAGNAEYRPLVDGESIAAGDRYWLGIRLDSPGCLYVVQVDARGKAEKLFPRNRLANSSIENPVRADETVQIPTPDAEPFELANDGGIVNLYIVLSASRWPELEEALARPMPAVLNVLPPGDHPLVGSSRGVRNATHNGIDALFNRDTEGKRQRLAATDRIEGAGHFMAIERWFRSTAK